MKSTYIIKKMTGTTPHKSEQANMPDRGFPKTSNGMGWMLLALGIYLVLQLAFITTTPNVMVDEPWYANVAHNFASGNGLVNTNPGSGGGTSTFLYTLLLGTFFKLTDTSLLTARLFSIIAGLVGLVGLIKILSFYEINHRLIFLITLLFTFSNVTYIIYRSVRPEGIMLSFIIWGVYYLLKALNIDNEGSSFLSGLCTSSAFLCHPNSAIYVFLFFLVILAHACQHKNYRIIFWYLSGCAIPFTSFLLYRIHVRQLDIFSMITSWGARTSVGSGGSNATAGFAASVWKNFSSLFSTYTLGIKRLYIFLFEIGILIYGLFQLKNRPVFLFSLLGICYFLLAVIFLKPFVSRHFGEVLIFSILSYALVLHMLKNRRKAVYSLAIIIGGLYLVNNLAGNAYLISKNFHHIPYQHIEKKLDNAIPDEATVLTLMHFWFPFKNNENFNSYTRWRKKEHNDLDSLMSSGAIDYVAISDYLTKGITPTAKRKLGVNNRRFMKNINYYEKVRRFAMENGILVESLEGGDYGTIEIWRLNH